MENVFGTQNNDIKEGHYILHSKTSKIKLDGNQHKTDISNDEILVNF